MRASGSPLPSSLSLAEVYGRRRGGPDCSLVPSTANEQMCQVTWEDGREGLTAQFGNAFRERIAEARGNLGRVAEKEAHLGANEECAVF